MVQILLGLLILGVGITWATVDVRRVNKALCYLIASSLFR